MRTRLDTLGEMAAKAERAASASRKASYARQVHAGQGVEPAAASLGMWRASSSGSTRTAARRPEPDSHKISIVYEQH